MPFRDRAFTHATIFTIGGVAALAVALGAAPNALAATMTTLHRFCTEANCTDGSWPQGAPITDSAGRIFGTTSGGGAYGEGVLYALVPKNGSYSYHVLHSFCSLANCADGASPQGPLILDQRGAIYGTAGTGGTGAGSGGAVFKFTPNKTRTGGNLTLLYSFCAQSDCSDGEGPVSGVTYVPQTRGALYDGKSPLYGTTLSDGGPNYGGVAFELRTVKGKTQRQDVTLYKFCARASCVDGSSPQELIAGPGATLYGATRSGGAYGQGAVFSIDAAHRTETVLHSLCKRSGCTDGSTGVGPLATDTNANLLGVASYGTPNAHGAIFRIVPNGTRSKYSVLYDFCPTDCSDGADPLNGVILDGNGNLFGVTSIGGKYNVNTGGTVFELEGGKRFHSLYSFCARSACSDGNYPQSRLFVDAQGNLYGTTLYGGITTNNNQSFGVVFKLSP